MKVPGPESAGLLHRETTLTLVTGGGACLGTAFLAAKAWMSLAPTRPVDGICEPATSKLVFVGCLVALAFSIIALIVGLARSSKKDRKENNPEGPLDLTACLYAAHPILCRSAADGCLRMTIHNVVGDKLVQSVPYVGGKGGIVGRKFDIHSGIIGRVARTAEPYKARRKTDDPEKFIREMMTEWHMTEAEARELDISRKAWLAVPVFGLDEKSVICVLFMDSNDGDFFTSDFEDLALAMAKGIATVIKKHYN